MVVASVVLAFLRGAPGVLDAGRTEGIGWQTFEGEAETAVIAVGVLNALHATVLLSVADTSAVAILGSCASSGLSTTAVVATIPIGASFSNK